MHASLHVLGVDDNSEVITQALTFVATANAIKYTGADIAFLDVEKNNLGFGYRSWRYAALIDNCKIIESFVEPGFEDNCEDDPYEMTSPQIILEYLKENEKKAV